MVTTLTPQTVDDLSFRELQAACKERGLTAKGKSTELKSRLLENLKNASPVAFKNAKTSATKTHTPANRRSLDKSPLAKAASTPLPSSGSKQRVTVARRAQSKPKDTLAVSLATAMAVIGILAALIFYGIPQCREHSKCSSELQKAEITAQQCLFAFREYSMKAVTQIQQHVADLHRTVGELVGLPQKEESPPTKFLMNGQEIINLLPDDGQWDNLKASFLSVATGHKLSKEKANSVLLCCFEDDCEDAAEIIISAACEDCILIVEAPMEKGALQKKLSNFIKSRPLGIVLIKDVDAMESDVLPVLINAMSEQGGFEENGSHVSTINATFLLTMKMPEEVISQQEEAAFKVAAKSYLVTHFAGEGPNKELGARFASALRRRIDLVVPIL